MCEICLWGNKTDLSIFTTLSHDDIQKIQGSKARKESESKILVNDVHKAFKVLQEAKKSGKPARVDIVLDNAGFELFVDMFLAGYLLTAGLATTVVLHPKSFPWFVSDVTPPDFQHLLGALYDSESFFGAALKTAEERAKIAFLFERWSTLHAEGKLILRPNHFWTEGGSFWRLPATAPALYEDLRESELVLFKGDLNYRKLTADGMWDPTTPFAEAIGPLGAPNSGVRVLALRTCKADAIVGLPKGRDEELKAMEGGGGNSGLRSWAYGGIWAVMQFHDGKQGDAA
jgi:damage-control phosphatase, subfamily III